MHSIVLVLDESQPNLLVLSDNSIHFYHVANVTHHHRRTPSPSFVGINLRNNHERTRVQYDHRQQFIIYYNSQQETLFW